MENSFKIKFLHEPYCNPGPGIATLIIYLFIFKYLIRSSPEVILENNYSHASDVWSFGILAWELYSAFATGQESKGYSLPYCDFAIDQVGIITA